MGSLSHQPRKKLLCDIVDDRAQLPLSSQKPFCIHPVSPDINDGWRNVSFEDLAAAVNYLAWWIEKTIGRSCFKSEPLAYLGINDIRYTIFILACMKSGYAAFLPSPRNSEAAFLHLLKETGCSKFLYSPERHKPIQDLQRVQESIQAWEVPPLWEMVDHTVDIYPCKSDFSQAENDTSIIIHSSGTTGFPKPVNITNGYWSAVDNLFHLPVPPGRRTAGIIRAEPGRTFFTMTPFFHQMGNYMAVMSICYNIPFVLSPPEKPLTVELMTRILDETKPTVTLLLPSLIEDLSSTDEGKATLLRFETIYFGGAPLAKDVGDKLPNLEIAIGSSETAMIPDMAIEDNAGTDWEYFEWNPYFGIEMRRFDDHGQHELILHRKKIEGVGNLTDRDYHAIFHTFPDLQEYRTNDTFVPHPTKPGLWKYSGRVDDVIVLSNGEKFNPIEMEKILDGHPLISRSLIVGKGQFHAAAIIEPSWKALDGLNLDKTSFIDQILPYVEKANAIAPAYGRLMKNNIVVASREKPFKFTPKGSTQRNAVIADYTEEIQSIYSRSGEDDNSYSIPQNATLEDISEFLQTILTGFLSIGRIPETSDIFALGLDSLQTLQLSKALHSTVHSLQPDINVNTALSNQKIYSHPSIAQLSRYIHSLVHGSNADDGPGGDDESDSQRRERLSNLVAKYTKDFPQNQVKELHRTAGNAVILTGSTGSLGNYILSELLKDQSISKIYCLNRSAEAEKRQLASFEEKGIPVDFTRVDFLTAQFGAKRFGLSSETYESLRESVDLIIHNAWKVNFNHRVEAFEETHIDGVRQLVQFSLDSPNHPHIHFISSVGTIGSAQTSLPAEIPFEQPDTVIRQGYAESKFVAERICAIGSAHSGVPTTIHRVGQIAGPTTQKGVWNKQEWLPSLVATSKTLGKVPRELGNMSVNWIPVDTLARIIVEISHSRKKTETDSRCAAFHLINPSNTPWQTLLPAIAKHYTVESVTFEDWIKALEGYNNPTEADLDDKPALKILDFYRGLDGGHGSSYHAETTKAQAASETMRNLEPINTTLMENWLQQWNF